jgi:hypothetical protein
LTWELLAQQQAEAYSEAHQFLVVSLVDVVEKEKEIELEGVETARQEIPEELINEANKLALDFWNLVKNPKDHEQKKQCLIADSVFRFYKST